MIFFNLNFVQNILRIELNWNCAAGIVLQIQMNPYTPNVEFNQKYSEICLFCCHYFTIILLFIFYFFVDAF